MKHEYSTIVLVFVIGFVIVTAIVGAIDSDDMDILCSSDGSLIKRVAGSWVCSDTNYAEGYYFNQTNPIVISIDDTNTTYNITGFIQSNINDFQFVDNGITVEEDGVYMFTYSVSFVGGNGGEYGFGLVVDGVQQKDCGMARTASSSIINNVGLTCIKTLSAGEHLNFVVRDATSPAQDISIYRMNANIVEVQ